MDFNRYLEELRMAPSYRGQIAHVERIPGRAAQYGTLERELHPALQGRLTAQGVRRLYAHQAEAINAARNGRDITVVTATASGKTLCYNLPVLDAVLNDSRSRAFYLFPTKALAQDQLGKLNDYGLFPDVRFATYDGDTPPEERRAVKRGAQIVLTNPDMLHLGILPYHSSWSAFLANLKYVVVDEMHTYRGVFGAHVAHVLRRLRRLCAHYGAHPQFLCCSATIANPQELTRKLADVHDPVVIDRNGAPAGPRTFVFWNPPFIGADQAQRRSANIEATSLFTDLVKQGVRNITFAKARKSTELILRYARNELDGSHPEMSRRITSYRAGYTIKERRAIEEALFSGALIGVTATNALELGVDVGGLDATVMTGYPGTIASTWQQAGRAGRGGEEALAVLVAMDNPLDQFLMRHPNYFFGRAHERAVVDPDNRRILSSHLLCAAYERALRPEDLPAFGANAQGCVEALTAQGRLLLRSGRWHYPGADYPAAAVNIRSAADGVFRIVDRNRNDCLIGTIETSVAFRAVHPGAVYLHMGETYLIDRLDITTRTAYARAADAQFYTETGESSDIQLLQGDLLQQEAEPPNPQHTTPEHPTPNTKYRTPNPQHQQAPMGRTTKYYGEVVVTNQVTYYRRKRLYTDEVLEVMDLDLPAQTFETEAFYFTVPPLIAKQLRDAGLDLAGSIHAVEHAAIGMMPLLCTCDRWDLGGVSHAEHPDTLLPTIFIYDGYPGGVGIAEATYERLEELLQATHANIRDCPCADGCPSCIQSPKCGNNNEPLDKQGARYLLELLLDIPPDV